MLIVVAALIMFVILYFEINYVLKLIVILKDVDV